MRNIIVYISGRYAGDTDTNLRLAREEAIRVWEAGYTALCPHLNTYHFEQDCKCTYDDYLAGDLVLLQKCDCVLMLQGWEQSNGARTEKEFAELNRIPVFYSLNQLIANYSSKVISEL